MSKPYVGTRLRSRVGRSRLGRLASHWVFQGVLYMDPTERVFKLAIDFVLAVVLVIPLTRVLHPARAGLVAALAAHSLNLVLNGQIWVAIRRESAGMEPDELMKNLDEVSGRLCRNPAIEQVYVYGSLVRGEISTGSDLDIRVMRMSGRMAGLQACIAVSKERTRALARRLPLDIYVCDSPRSLIKMRSDEVPLPCCEGLVGLPPVTPSARYANSPHE